MNGANGPNRPLPTNLSPPLTKCFQITLPDDTDFQAAFFDALYQLTYWFAWARDDAQSGAIVARTWMNILATLRSCRPEPASEGCCGDGDTQLIRQNPDNPCLIESSMDGVHWCTLVDLSLCIAPTGQPGGGAEQPAPGGGEACYQGTLSAAQQWLLPTVVSTGDVLTFSNIQGAGTDGTGIWYCENGEVFFGGACIGGQFTAGGDPAPALHHMTILARIGAAYYDITAGPITVPSSISNAPVTLQVNDATLSDNSGDYKFSVCVTNNQTTGWCYRVNFALSDGGWTNLIDSDVTVAHGVWTAGQGWVSTTALTSSGVYRNAVYIKAPALSFVPDQVLVRYSFTRGQVNNNNDAVIEVQSGSSGLAADTNLADTADTIKTFVGPYTLNPAALYLACARHDGGAPSPTGVCVIKSVTFLKSSGVNPFGASNC